MKPFLENLSTEWLLKQIGGERVLNDLKTRSFIGIVFLLVTVTTIHFTYGFYARHPDLVFSFFIPLAILCLFRALHLYWFIHAVPRYPQLNALIFITCILLSAFIWGRGFLHIMIIQQEYSTKTLAVLATAGICSGSIVAYIPNRFLAVTYNLLLLWPTALYLLFTDSSKTTGALIMLYSFYMFVIAIKGNKEYWRAVHNEDLLRKQSKKLEILSRTDGLTGLLNRRHFEERFEQEWKKAIRLKTEVSVLLCDLDYFKQINDEYGHQVGDEIIKATAQNLKKVFKRATDIICRYGGEEFAVLLPGGIEEAKALAKQLLTLQAQTTIPSHGKQIGATISIGLITASPSISSSKDSLLILADQALYAAKDAGRNTVKIIVPESLDKKSSNPDINPTD